MVSTEGGLTHELPQTRRAGPQLTTQTDDARRDARKARPRMLQLDILRGVAILLVIGNHRFMDPIEGGHLRPLLSLWLRFGWTGVDLFFVLSGFLVGGLLMEELRTWGTVDVHRFLVRRAFKIWPSYFLYIGFVFLAVCYQVGPAKAFMALLPNLMHLQNYLGSPRGHTWSLAVEEHFYLVLPFFLLWAANNFQLRRRSQRTRSQRTRSHQQYIGNQAEAMQAIPLVAILLLVGCTALRVFFNLHQPFSLERDVFPTHLRLDSLFWGVLLAYIYHFRPDLVQRLNSHRAALALLGLMLVSPMMVLKEYGSAFVWTLGFTLLYLGYGCLLLAAVLTPLEESRAGRLMNSPAGRALAAIGLFSYPI